MKAPLIAVAAALAVAPALTSGAAASQGHAGSWSFADYTPDPASLAADDAFHTTTGATVSSYCHGSRVPSAPQDVTSHSLTVARAAVLRLQLTATGAWGVDIASRHGKALTGITTASAAANGTGLRVRLRPGQYVVRACNLGGAPTARVDYSLG